MKKLTILLVLAIVILAGCNLKVNLNSNLNQSNIQVEPNVNQNLNQPVTDNTNTQALNDNTNLVANETVDFTFKTTGDNQAEQVINKKSGEVWIDSLEKLCGAAVMIYAHPENSMKVIMTRFNPGSEKEVSTLYLLYLQNKTCTKLEVSKELGAAGARILSPDQAKLAVALETDEARDLIVLDLLGDTSKTVVTLAEGETLNAGYGALSNHFDIKWLDNEKIQYTVYNDTVKNFDTKAPAELEKVKEVRIVSIQ